MGPFKINESFLAAEAEGIAPGGPGIGGWVNASLVNVEAGVGPVGIRGGINADTGIGIRGGNLDVHLLGFGGKIGADGIQLDTPLVGVKNCSIM